MYAASTLSFSHPLCRVSLRGFAGQATSDVECHREGNFLNNSPPLLLRHGTSRVSCSDQRRSRSSRYFSCFPSSFYLPYERCAEPASDSSRSSAETGATPPQQQLGYTLDCRQKTCSSIPGLELCFNARTESAIRGEVKQGSGYQGRARLRGRHETNGVSERAVEAVRSRN